MKMRPNELCRVKNTAVGRVSDGYSSATFLKMVNGHSAKINVMLGVATAGLEYVVNMSTLWKIKAKQRKVLQRKFYRSFNKPSVNSTSSELNPELTLTTELPELTLATELN